MLKPGGALHFLEHGLSDDPKVADLAASPRPAPAPAGRGCHLTRDPAALAEQAGLAVVAVERFRLPAVPPRPWTAGVRGRGWRRA